jgi:serine/threonine-protein kinase RsbW
MTTFSTKIPPTPTALPALMHMLLASVSLDGLDEVARHHLQLIVEEMVVNVIDHGQLSTDDYIDLQLRREQGDLVIEMRDRGLAFDPTRPPAADTTSGLEDRPIGGLGVHLVQTLCDDIRYQRQHDENQTIIRLRVARP